MFRKLIKYEWLSIWKVPAAINLFLAAITLIGMLFLSLPFWKFGGDVFPAIDFYRSAGIFFYIISLAASSIAVTVYIAVRYYLSMYGDEGYLTHTLPVTTRQIVLSKILVGSAWIFINLTVVLTSSSSLLIFDSRRNSPDLSAVYNAKQALQYFKKGVSDGMNMNFTVFCILALLYLILNSVCSLLMIYSSIALGQLMTKHKLMGAFLFYFVEYSIIQLLSLVGISSFFSVSKGLQSVGSGKIDPQMLPRFFFSSFFVIIFIITAIVGIIQYFITVYMAAKKLNLD